MVEEYRMPEHPVSIVYMRVYDGGAADRKTSVRIPENMKPHEREGLLEHLELCGYEPFIQ